jgi:XPC-binding domain
MVLHGRQSTLLHLIPQPLRRLHLLNLLLNPLNLLLPRTCSRFVMLWPWYTTYRCLISHSIQLAQQQQQQPTTPVAPGLGASPTASGLDAPGLRADPRLAALRELAGQNPALLQPVIQQLAQNNPQLAQALASDPNALLDLLGGAEGEEGEAIPPGAHVINVTPEERAAIERVCFLPYLLQYHFLTCHIVRGSWLSPTCRH